MDWNGSFQILPPSLRRFASAFADLQQTRHSADYNNIRVWGIAEVVEVLNAAEYAFHDWLAIRTDPMAGNFLLSMLLGKRRA